MTGLIYVILIAMWGVVLVPRWLRHHDESRRRKESERLERALGPQSVHTERVASASQSWGEYLRSLAHVDTNEWLAQVRRPHSEQARRRRTIVVALASLFTLSLLGAVVGVAPGFIPVMSGLLLAAYASAVFFQMRQWEAHRVDHGTEWVESDEHHSATLQPGDLAEPSDGVRVVRSSGSAGTEWDPRETTLPTYVSKAKASKIPRRIDLTRDGWNGAGMVQQARAQRAHSDHFDQEFELVEPVQDLAPYADPDSDRQSWKRAANE